MAEGFCLFAYLEILRLESIKFYLDVPHQVCAGRRIKRRPQRPSDRSFALIGAKESATFVLPQKDIPGVQVLDGMRPTVDLVEAVLAAIPR